MKGSRKSWLSLFISVLFVALILSTTIRVGIAPAVSANTQNSVTASVNVLLSCTISLSNTLINFGSLTPGTASTPANVVSDTNNGNEAAYIWLSGGNWIGTSATINFFVGNTEWNGASFTPAFPTAAGFNDLTLTATNTQDYVNTLSTNTIFFGLYIPAGQTANVYSQTINALNVC